MKIASAGVSTLTTLLVTFLLAAPVPEAGTLLLLGSGLAGLFAGGWRKRRRATASFQADVQ